MTSVDKLKETIIRQSKKGEELSKKTFINLQGEDQSCKPWLAQCRPMAALFCGAGTGNCLYLDFFTLVHVYRVETSELR